MSKILLFFHTVRYLTVRQIFFQLKARVFKSRVNLNKAQALNLRSDLNAVLDLSRGFVPRWTGGEAGSVEGGFEFISETVKYKEGVDWSESRFGGLWLDHLHYFRYLDVLSGTADKVNQGYKLIMSWAIGRLSVNKAFWPPYNASERAFCMGRWLLLNRGLLSEQQISKVTMIIYQDIDFVSQHLEWNLDGNHLLKNISAVWWGCHLFDEAHAKKWQAMVNLHLKSIVSNQVLEDGLHYEKSPLYHQLALIDFVDILSVMPADSIDYDYLSSLVMKMYSAFKFLIHPDGLSCMFGDSPANLSAPASEVIRFCDDFIGEPLIPHELPVAGYYQLSTDSDFYIIADTGDLGPDEQMGHAHSDMLHFELSFRGKRVLVEGGTSSYYDSIRRPYERSTCAHNTLSLNGASQCQSWSNFRVAQRGHCQVNEHLIQKSKRTLVAQHDGFISTYGVHHRRLFNYQKGVLIVEDFIDYCFKNRAARIERIESYLHFSSRCYLKDIDETSILISVDGDELYLVIENASFEITSMNYGVGYNQIKKGTCVKMVMKEGTAGAKFSFIGGKLKFQEYLKGGLSL